MRWRLLLEESRSEIVHTADTANASSNAITGLKMDLNYTLHTNSLHDLGESDYNHIQHRNMSMLLSQPLADNAKLD